MELDFSRLNALADKNKDMLDNKNRYIEEYEARTKEYEEQIKEYKARIEELEMQLDSGLAEKIRMLAAKIDMFDTTFDVFAKTFKVFSSKIDAVEKGFNMFTSDMEELKHINEANNVAVGYVDFRELTVQLTKENSELQKELDKMKNL